MNCTIISSQRANQFRTHQTSWIKQETSSFGNRYLQKQLSMEYQLVCIFQRSFHQFLQQQSTSGSDTQGARSVYLHMEIYAPFPPLTWPSQVYNKKKLSFSFLFCRNGLGNTECYVWNVLSSYMRSLLKLGLSSSLLNRHLSSQLCCEQSPPKQASQRIPTNQTSRRMAFSSSASPCQLIVLPYRPSQ